MDEPSIGIIWMSPQTAYTSTPPLEYRMNSTSCHTDKPMMAPIGEHPVSFLTFMVGRGQNLHKNEFIHGRVKTLNNITIMRKQGTDG